MVDDSIVWDADVARRFGWFYAFLMRFHFETGHGWLYGFVPAVDGATAPTVTP